MSSRSWPRLTFGGAQVTGRSRAAPFAGEPKPPERTDVVVIGGGIVGAMTALCLAERGVAVTLCEKGSIAGEASGRSLGQVGSAGLASEKMELLGLAKRRWAELNGRVEAETGYRRNGYLAPFADDASRAMWEDWLATAGRQDPGAQLLDGAEATRRAPGSSPWSGAFLNPDDGCAEPTLATAAIAAAARRRGARIVAPCAVRALDLEGGRIAGVVTETGRIRAAQVVLAGGCWSRLFCANAGLQLPLLNVHAYCESVYGVDAGPDGAGDAPGVSWRRQIDGGYTVCVIGGAVPLTPAVLRLGPQYLALLGGVHWELDVSFGRTFFQELAMPRRWSPDVPSPFERWRVLEAGASPKFERLARERIATCFPAFRTMRPAGPWTGVLCTPPDNTPTMSAVSALPGLFLATGFSYGLTMAPAAGELVADLVTGTSPCVDPRPYRYERYIDGTRLVPLA